MTPRTRKGLFVVLFLALAIRVAYVLEAQSNPLHLAPQMDAGYHLQWARALLSGEVYHPGPFFRAPLYPWFLAAGLWLSQGSLLTTLLVQALLGVVTTWLTFDLARRAFPRSGSTGPLLASLLVATNWILVYFDGELLLPALAIPLQLFALKKTLDLNSSPTPRSAISTGALWGIAALVRPNCLLFVGLLVVWRLLRAPRKPLVALALAGGTLLPILPITAYNASQGDAVLISSQAGINLWIGNNPDSDGSTAIVPGTRPDWWGGHIDANRQAEAFEGRALRPSEVSRSYTGRALAWAAEDPGAWLSLLLHKARLLISHRELGNNADVRHLAHHFSSTMRALPPSFALLFALGAAGLFLGWRRRELAPELPVFLFVYAASIILFFVCARYRAPLLPLFACGAGHAIAWSYAALRAGRRRGPLRVALFACCLAALSLWSSPTESDRDAPGLWQRGVMAQRAGDPSAAIEHYQAALDLQPRYWLASRDLGDAYLSLKQFQQAEDALRRGLALRPDEPWLADKLCEVLLEAGRPEELRPFVQTFVGMRPDHATGHYFLARVHHLLGDRPAALASLIDGLKVDPTNFQCLFFHARFLESSDAPAACASIRAALNSAQRSHNQEFEQLAKDELRRLGCP